jgi:hypothetical protein
MANFKKISEKQKKLLSYYIKMTRKIATPYVIKLESEIKSLESEPEEMTVSYIKSEYDQQFRRMTEIFGMKPSVFEQGVNGLLAIVEGKIHLKDQSPQLTDEEILEYFMKDKYPIATATDRIGFSHAEVGLIVRSKAEGAKAYRDGTIKPTKP